MSRPSKAIWIPVVWVLLAGSRPVSQWLMIAPDASIDPNLDGNPLDRLIFSAILLAGIIVLAARGHKAARLSLLNGPVLLFVCYCGISALWSDFPGIAFKRWVKALGDPVMIMIVLTDPDRRSAIKRYLAATAFFFMPVSILFVKYYPALGLHFNRLDGGMSFVGVATDKNMLGALCLFAGLGAAWRVLHLVGGSQQGPRKGPLLAQGVILAMAIWLLWKANSMTSIACLTFASTVMLATTVSAIARRRVVVHGLVVLVLAAACIPIFLQLGDVLSAVGRDPTLTQRTELWSAVVRLAPHPLVGAGFETFWLGPRLEKLWTQFWWRPNESHNGYLEVYLNLGWIGATLLAVVILSGYRNALSVLRQDPQAGRLKLVCLVAGVIYGLTEAGFRMMHPIWLSTLLAAFIVPVEARLEASSTKDDIVKLHEWRAPAKHRDSMRASHPVRPAAKARPSLERVP